MGRNSGGRPKLEKGRRDYFISIRLNAEELSALKQLCKTLNLNESAYIRKIVFQKDRLISTFDGKSLLASLDAIGAELGRSGNNINQLARHANILNKNAQLEPSLVSDFNGLYTTYIQTLKALDVQFRALLRLSKNQ